MSCGRHATEGAGRPWIRGGNRPLRDRFLSGFSGQMFGRMFGLLSADMALDPRQRQTPSVYVKGRRYRPETANRWWRRPRPR